jgi:hypothetical protein
VEKKDFDTILESYIDSLSIKKEYYLITPIIKIIFSYIVYDKGKLTNNKKSYKKENIDKEVEFFHLYGYDLPNSMDTNLFGDLVNAYNNNKSLIIQKTNSNIFY